ncbi:cytochrome c-type bioproteinis protein CcmH [Maritalea myrionectae]|uniref:Cytochrome c-type biogenesis protein n=1 Tax=Maritalea myrionectae TaxID=454601 RepID=A0A2R4MGM2_9HYPH|nr:cytochrome c-type biogenesis protein [Maritalea myrionectae]AVX05115.1 cytochrome c-type bioproteinis protein CcmH [Maritalea myrionectae]
MNRFLMILILIVSFVPQSFAVQPDEVLDDPVLEERARDISEGLRCLVCQNQSIDDSDADLARDLRIVVRERLVAGDSNDEVVDYVVARYGEFVLLKPTFSGHNLVLWIAAPLIFVIGLVILFVVSMRQRKVSNAAAMTPEEEQVLAELTESETDSANKDQTSRQSAD